MSSNGNDSCELIKLLLNKELLINIKQVEFGSGGED